MKCSTISKIEIRSQYYELKIGQENILSMEKVRKCLKMFTCIKCGNLDYITMMIMAPMPL